MVRIISILLLVFAIRPTSGADQPNILFLIADDASRTSFGCYGATYVQTPHFDRIAREGVRFTQAYNCNPKCAPARACLLTGRYSWQLEAACNHNPVMPDKWKFYPELLESHGYFVGYTGKGWGPGVAKGIGLGKDKFQQENPAGHPYVGKTLSPPYKGINKADYAANFSDFLQIVPDDTPFCFWLGTREPHRGYEKDSYRKAGRSLEDVEVQPFYPDNEVVRGDLADYALEVEWYDKHIGRVLQTLEHQGLLQDTLIIATSDHGMPFPRVKGQVYDEGFHVPFVARWGAKIRPGRVVTDFITFPDLAPTLMEIAGAAIHPQMTGKSFLPQLLSNESGRIDSDRNHTLLGKERHDIGRTDGDRLSVGYPARAIRTDRFLYVRNFKSDRWPTGDPEYGLLNCDNSPTKSWLTAISRSSPQFKFYELSFGKRPEEELYDMQLDPHCVNNLADQPDLEASKSKLWDQLKRELTEQKDPRILGLGDIFDFYPNCRSDRQKQLYQKPDFDPVAEFETRYGDQTK